ncbi:MAG: hypothetical protein DMF31_04715, partial [Verrucomicrobia bacterium]
RVGTGVGPCAAPANTPACTHRIVRTKSAHDRTIRFCIILLFQKRIACSTVDGLFCTAPTKLKLVVAKNVERVAFNALATNAAEAV